MGLAGQLRHDVMMAVIQRYRSENPHSQVSDEKLVETLANGTEMSLQKHTHLIRITVRSDNLEFSAALANAYVMAADTYTQDQNHEQAEKVKDFLKTTVEAQKRDLTRRDQKIFDFRSANQIDTMEREYKKAESAELALNAECVSLETQINHATAAAKALETTHKNADEVARLRDSSKTDRDLLLEQLADTRRRCEEMGKRASELDQKIMAAKDSLETLLSERNVATTKYLDTLNREREAVMAYDDNAPIITIVEKAPIPQQVSSVRPRPVSPNPFIILPAGLAIGIDIGILLVLFLLCRGYHDAVPPPMKQRGPE
jgi:uncharacterized protein involved in exopolysaccharide biosynthesis